VLRYLTSFVLAAVCTPAAPALAQYPYPPSGWGYRSDTTGSARLQVTPNNAEVYIDGYFVGIVDDFDGALQRLHVEAGEHELQIYLAGYRTITEKVRFTPATTLKASYTMERLAPGEAPPPRPSPDENAARERQRGRPVDNRGQSDSDPFGTLALRVQPADATILVDGEQWTLPAGEDRLFIELPEGAHRLEIRKDGFRTYSRTSEARRGRTIMVNVSLTPGSDSLDGLQ
jgi:hypothetical protein